MNLQGLFNLPVESGVAAFAEAQVRLFRQDASLQDYFQPLQLNFWKSPGSELPMRRLSTKALDWAAAKACRTGRLVPRRTYKVDILFIPTPYYGRKTENDLTVRILIALAGTGASILCLIADGAPCRAEIVDKLAANGRSNQVTLLDPTAALNRLTTRYLTRTARHRSRQVFRQMTEVLDGLGGRLPGESISEFEQIAAFVEAWNCLEGFIDFNAVVTRCHWLGLCSPACRTALGRGKRVITFQQGVIGHTLDVPVSATKYVAFGNASANFLDRMNRSFFQAVGVPGPTPEFVRGGCLFDSVLNLPDQFAKHTLLIIDEPVGMNDFYGIGCQREAIFRLAEKLVVSSNRFKIVVRPHPYWNSLGLDAWKALVLKYPDFFELSHPTWTLEEDLSRSSVVLGIFSGVLTVAAASGLPTFFITTQPGYATEDLACFHPSQTLLPEDTFVKISRVLTDPQVYAEARETSLRCAREYYHNGSQLELNAALFDRLLG